MNDLEIIKPKVFERDGQLWTTSLSVAEIFMSGRHDNVVGKIRDLGLPGDFGLLNFKETSYVDKWNRKQPMYEMTQDGWTFLVMGFTGAKAAKFKVKYIEAFNTMRETIETSLIPKGQDVIIAQNQEILKRLTDVAVIHETKLANIEKTTSEVAFDMKEVKTRVGRIEKRFRKKFTDKTVSIWNGTIDTFYQYKCPMCMRVDITGDYEKDHYYNPSWNKVTEGWIICKECHKKLTYGDEGREGWVKNAFTLFQDRVAQFIMQRTRQLELF